jgi:hypothetical protein
MDGRTESQDLKDIRKLVEKDKIPPENIVEFYGPEDGIEALKERIREKTAGQCYFFTREEKNEIHLIALVNIKDVAQLFNKLKEINELHKMNYNISQKSDFEPNGITFGKFG